MFLGEYQHALDPKGRLILPSAYRDDLQEGLVMTVGLDHCLAVYPLPAWERVKEGLRSLRATDRRERMFTRMVTSSAHHETLDRQGRITIPARLRDYASLTKDVAVVGADEHLELWDASRWDAYRGEGMAEFATTEQAFDLGIF
ncbi:MAG: division/cell wall cluster transcriptional repressor MraZ [Actinomycetota bacterium]|nr:division/cell wall cluster transcriptional repressor MraZ [Actinomycetota bacterium]